MKKKVFSLMMTLLLAFVGVAKADVVTIGEGTSTNYYGPFNSLWGYSFVEQVYTANEIGTAGTITAISFNLSSGSQTNAIEVFMKNVSRTNFSSSSDWETVTASDMVFSGTVTFNAGWTTITLDTPFEYDGTSNLMVGMHEFTSGYSTLYFYHSSVTKGLISGHSDSANPNPYDMGSYSGSKYTQNYRTNIQLDITAGAGGEDRLHVKYMAGNEEVIDSLNLGVRPIGAWMEPFNFTMYSEGPNYTVTLLDFTPDDGLFEAAGQELPFQVNGNNDAELVINTNATQAGVIERQFVAITEGNRVAHIWPIVVEMYDPAIPDVVEKAYDFGTIDDGFSYVGIPANITPTTLHNDYTLPFPEIQEGMDAVYKLTIPADMKISANVSQGENGKVALYAENFNGENGPMADNNYIGIINGGGSTAASYEAMIGDETSTSYTGYMPYYTLYNYSISEALYTAAELEEAGVTTAPMTSLSWEAIDVTTTQTQNNISIWMANVDDTELTTTSHNASNMTLVYTGNTDIPPMGWNEFVFNQGTFAWDGHSNVLILCQRNNGQWSGHVYWRSHNPGFYGMSYEYQDSYAYDVTAQTYSLFRSNTARPNIILKGGNRSLDRSYSNVVFTMNDSYGDGWNGGYINVQYGNTNIQMSCVGSSSVSTLPIPGGSNVTLSWVSGSFDDEVSFTVTYDGGTTIYSATEPNAGTLTTFTTPGSSAPGEFIDLTFNLEDSWGDGWNDGAIAVNYGGGTFNVTLASGSEGTTIVPLPAGAHIILNWIQGGYDSEVSFNIVLDGNTIYAISQPGAGTLVEFDMPGNGGNTPDEPIVPFGNYSAGPVITDLPVRPGTYYLVASSTTPDFEVTINAENMPCPTIDAEGFAFNPQPADNEDEIEPASVTLHWQIPAYATGWRLIFGTTYHPEASHPQTVMYPEDGSWETNMANSFTVRNLWNNNNYFWRVEFNNSACPEGVSSPVWGFTTHLNIPQNLTVVDETVFNDEEIVLNWNAVVDRTYRQYNVYRDGELIGNTQVNNIGNTTFTDGPLAYNMNGYTYYVTAVYDEGESAPSNTVNVKVSGRGNVNGHVYEQDGETGIAGATVTMMGQDEFGDSHTYNFTTDGAGYYSGVVYAGSYFGQADCNGYQTIYEPVQGNPIEITYNVTTTPVDYMMNENFDPVCEVFAQYYPDSTDINAPYVKVFWGCGFTPDAIVEPFETGDFSLFDWQVSANYPWVITTENPYEGQYCMKSGNQQVLSSTSTMQVTVNIPADGEMSFFGKISCEQSWDYGYFYIDGQQMGSYTGNGNWAERKFPVTAGDHTFMWEYTEDFMISDYDDCFYVDYITFYRQPEPVEPGWVFYDDGVNMDAIGLTAGGSFYWGVMFPAGQYAGNTVTKVSMYDYSAHTGNIIICQGGTTAPGTQLYTQPYTCTGSEDFVEWTLNTPVNIDPTQPLWIVMNNNNGQYVASACANTGNPNGRWISLDGMTWEDVAGYGLDYTWMLRAYVANGAKGEYVASTTAMPQLAQMHKFAKGEAIVSPFSISGNGESHAVSTPARSGNRAFAHYRIYRTDCYNDGPYTPENTALLASEVTDTVYIDTYWPDVAPGVYKWGVSCVYIGNRGEEIESEIAWGEPVVYGGATRDELTFNFDDGTMSGWTTIDADGDGLTWVSSSAPGVYHNAGVNLTGTGHDASAHYVISGSYANGTGAVLYPDNYLVSPQIALGGSISFYACAQDAGYAAEHFGVAVSTNSNTNAADFTTVQEWTMSAKGVSNVASAGRDGNNRVQGNWYQYTVDLSAYSGMGYVAIRHFNCYDQFILNVDDITLTTSANPNPNPNPGAYGWEFEGNESEIVWSNCLEKNMWLSNVDVNVLLNSADSPEGTVVTLTNLNEAEQANYPMAPVVLDGSGFYAWDAFRRGEYAVKVEHDGYEPIADTVSIWDETHLRYVMIEILFPMVSDIYVSRTGWAMWGGDYMPNGSGPVNPTGGDSFTESWDNGLNGWTLIDNDGDGHNWYHSTEAGNHSTAAVTSHTGAGHLMGESYCNATWAALTPDDYVVAPQQYAIGTGSTFSFWACTQDVSYPSEHFGIAISTGSNTSASDFTTIAEWTITAKGAGKEVNGRDGRATREGNWYNFSADLSNYAGQNVWIAIRHFGCTDQFILNIDDAELSSGRSDRHFEYYKVMCTSIDGVPIYNHNTVHPFCQLSTNEPYNAPLIEGDHYLVKVAVMYSTGLSAWSEPVEWVYEPCDHWGPVDYVDVDATNQGNHITWAFEHGYNPYPLDGGDGNEPGDGDSFTESWDNGLNGWTLIDNDGDGHNWYPSSEAGNHSTAAVTSHTGAGHLMGESYCNATWAALTPDDYVVAPQQYAITNGSTFSFWACTQDVSYPSEHFGIAISTGSNTNASDFTTIAEWTITAKGAGKEIVGRNGRATREGNWYNFSADLSNYAGQNVWIAIRHFGCTDMFILNIDDAELTAGAKGSQATAFTGMMGSAYSFDITDIANFDERVYFLYNLNNDSRFNVINGEANGQFIISLSAGNEDLDLEEAVNEFRWQMANEFAMMDKVLASQTAYAYKAEMPKSFTNSLMMDVYAKSRENNLCATADPFCTDNGMYEFPAGVNAGEGEAGPDYDCLYTTPNPAWYYMRISDPGDMDIYMYSTPSVDIDFCCWGPFDNPNDPCPNGLTYDKVVSCSYSAAPTEHCMIPASAQTGEYYILVITNYSNQACNINFSKVAGSGSTDCTIVSDVDVFGFLITLDGEYLDIVGPNVREYTHAGEFGEHEYCVRPIYPGLSNMPEENYYFSMGCPVCEVGPNGGGEADCEPVSNLNGTYMYYEGEGLMIDWEDPAGAESIILYADGEAIVELPAGYHPVFLSFEGDVPEHTFIIGAVAVHADCVSEMVETSVYYDDVNENGIVRALFPNPTNSNVTIQAPGMNHITVVNALGQVVYDLDLKADEYILNMSQFNAGMYMVRISTEYGVAVKRVTVIQ